MSRPAAMLRCLGEKTGVPFAEQEVRKNGYRLDRSRYSKLLHSFIFHRTKTAYSWPSMVTINVAYTQIVNPSGASPIITRAQLWAAMEMKVREAHKFVPVFSDCKVLEEHDNVIVRETTLKPMEGRPGKTQKETCKLYKPVKVDFYEPTGAVITNMVSDGPNMTDEELQMTYFFEWLHPNVEAGSEEEMKLTKQHKMRGKMSVDKTIESVRNMVEAGKF